MFLIVSLVGIAALFVLLESYFLAVIQTLVYAGAVVVLFLFILGTSIGTVYAASVQSGGAGLFYSPTLIVQSQIGWLIIYPYGVFFGAVIALSYGIFRLGMGHLLSTMCAFAFMVSSFHLSFLIPSILRDYAKAPFILAVILIIGLMIKEPLEKARLLTLSAACGIVIGLGIGFRQDLIICILPFIVVLFLFLPGPLLTNTKIKFAALMIFIMVFLSFGSPMRRQSSVV